MAEGLNKAIELKGIARNAAPSTCQDGELEEIINLRFKDGSWKPVGELESIGEVGMYDNLHIHTNTYRHLLGTQNGVLYWLGEIVDGVLSNYILPIEMAKVSGKVSIKQTGHLLTIIDDEGLTYALYNTQAEEYVIINADFNGKQTDTSLIPEGLVDFRVTAIEDELGRPLYLSLKENLDFSKIDDAAHSAELTDKVKKEAQENAKDIATAIYYKGLDLAKKDNLFVEGYFLLTTAIELYDGNHILQSRPILLAPPSVTKKESRKYVVASSLNGSVPNPNLQVCEELLKGNASVGSVGSVTEGATSTNCVFDEERLFGGVFHQFVINHEFNNYRQSMLGLAKTYPLHPTIVENKIGKEFDGAKYADVTTSKRMLKADEAGGIEGALWAYNVKPYIPNCITCDTAQRAEDDAVYLHMLANKLQVRFNQSVSREYADVFKKVSIFITPQVDYLKHDDEKEYAIGVSDYLFVDRNNTHDYQIYIPYKSDEDILKEIKRLSSFYKIADIELSNVKAGDWVDVEIEDGLLSVLTEQERLTLDGFSRNSYAPKTAFTYNGRLHIANYTSEMFRGFPLSYFEGHNSSGQWSVDMPTDELIPLLGDAFVKVKVETAEGDRFVYREWENVEALSKLNPILSYPDSRAKEMTIVANTKTMGTHYEQTFKLESHPYFNFAYYISPDLKPINILSEGTKSGIIECPIGKVKENKDNYIKVSSVDNPFYFPVANTYQIGNSEIIGFATNTIAMSIGQAGDAPLYVFTKDGIYALFVDASGQLTYTNSRPIARDVCNNPKSITPIDDGVLFTTDRGLMLLSGSEVIDMSDVAEGVPFDINDISDAKKCISHPQLVDLEIVTSSTNFLTYLEGATIGYNYFDKEIWVTNKAYNYSYVYNLKVKGWTKRTEVGKELVGDYPYLYMLDREQTLRNIAKEIVGETETMFLTRPIKLQTQEFKQGYRTILRSLLEGGDAIECEVLDATQSILTLQNRKVYEIDVEGKPTKFYYTSRSGKVNTNVVIANIKDGTYLTLSGDEAYCGLYLFGSYDCRKWALIGARERDGEIRDLGLLSHRVDCKYFRLLFVGKLKEGSTIEYVEMSAEARLLADKIR